MVGNSFLVQCILEWNLYCLVCIRSQHGVLKQCKLFEVAFWPVYIRMEYCTVWSSFLVCIVELTPLSSVCYCSSSVWSQPSPLWYMYLLPPLDVVRDGHRHGKVATEIPHFNPRILGDCGGRPVTELKIRFSFNGWLCSSARGGGASRRRQLRPFVSCFVYFYFSLSESICDSMVSHYQRNYGEFCSRQQSRKQQAPSLWCSNSGYHWNS